MTGLENGAALAVLVVEDEPLLRMETADMMEDTGFEVYEAANADVALILLEKHPEVRILFTDVDMLGSMDGLALAHAVRDRWPPVAIIIVSGHFRIDATSLPENGVFFSKPYRPTLIMQTVRRFAQAA